VLLGTPVDGIRGGLTDGDQAAAAITLTRHGSSGMRVSKPKLRSLRRTAPRAAATGDELVRERVAQVPLRISDADHAVRVRATCVEVFRARKAPASAFSLDRCFHDAPGVCAIVVMIIASSDSPRVSCTFLDRSSFV
jgi:hypothetical protein